MKRRIKGIRHLTDNTYILSFEKENLNFMPGQYISVGIEGSLNHREYSIYSGENDEYVDVLIREVTNGNVSVQLRNCRPGQMLEVDGPFGYMTLNREEIYNKKYVFIASGTGIAPFHSFILSYPGIDYTLLHGVRFSDEAYDMNDYAAGRYILCTSGEEDLYTSGRITSCLEKMDIDDNHLYYICGNSNMIYSVYDILRKKGVNLSNIKSEVYF